MPEREKRFRTSCKLGRPMKMPERLSRLCTICELSEMEVWRLSQGRNQAPIQIFMRRILKTMSSINTWNAINETPSLRTGINSDC
jgi:hypothetical protein